MTNLTGGPVELGAPAMTINPKPAKPEEKAPQTEQQKESGDAEKERKDGDDTSR